MLRFTYFMLCIVLGVFPVAAAERATVAAVIETVQKTLAKAKTVLVDPDMPPLKSVTLNLTTTTAVDASAGVDVYLVSVGASDQSSQTQKQKIVLTFKPHVIDFAEQKINKGDDIRVSDRLAQVIVTTLNGLKNLLKAKWSAPETNQPNKPAPSNSVVANVVPKSFTVTFGLAASTKFNGGLALVAAPVTAKLGADYAPGDSQEFVFQFGEEAKDKDEDKKDADKKDSKKQ